MAKSIVEEISDLKQAVALLGRTVERQAVELRSQANKSLDVAKGTVQRITICGETFYITGDGKAFLSFVSATGLAVYANNAAAVAGGLAVGSFYRTGANPDPVCVVH